MDVVWSLVEGEHQFQVERLSEPKMVGASLRRYRLWHNGAPALGGQWHSTEESAIARADYLLLDTNVRRIDWLERRVAQLEAEIARLSSGSR